MLHGPPETNEGVRETMQDVPGYSGKCPHMAQTSTFMSLSGSKKGVSDSTLSLPDCMQQCQHSPCCGMPSESSSPKSSSSSSNADSSRSLLRNDAGLLSVPDPPNLPRSPVFCSSGGLPCTCAATKPAEQNKAVRSANLSNTRTSSCSRSENNKFKTSTVAQWGCRGQRRLTCQAQGD
jgi:hypothetical protein